MQTAKMEHQQKVLDLLQEIEFKSDFIPLSKDKFYEDIRDLERKAEEERYRRIERQQMLENAKKESLVRIKALERERKSKVRIREMESGSEMSSIDGNSPAGIINPSLSLSKSIGLNKSYAMQKKEPFENIVFEGKKSGNLSDSDSLPF